ncbi:flagellar motor switch protein FliG [endosymbiont of unidentified scaly snail isolate Monju]|nr:flagellar motor switch protein FliG [endosymbiont of unidentified scaly snail isolate Monju]
MPPRCSSTWSPRRYRRSAWRCPPLSNITNSQMELVMHEFVEAIGEQTSLGMGSDEYIRNMLTKALGSDKASGVIDRILLGRNSKGLEQLKWMDPRAIAELIRYEHPQIIAIVMSFLDPDQAAGVLAEFHDPRVRNDVIMRIATLEGIQPNALQELDKILERQLEGNTNIKSSALGGVKKAADILNFVDGSIEAEIIEGIQKADEELAQEIQDNMFVFENLIDLDDRGMQTLLREVSSDQLLLALRGAPDALKEKIFKNMSSRAAEMLKDDLEAAPPVKVSDVEAAQKEILSIARKLAEAGDIMLGGGGGDDFI